jgi:hypothetical protein
MSVILLPELDYCEQPPAYDANELQYIGYNKQWGRHFFRDRKTGEFFSIKPEGNVEMTLKDIRKKAGHIDFVPRKP